MRRRGALSGPGRCGTLLLLGALGGCAATPYVPAPLDLEAGQQALLARRLDDPSLVAPLAALDLDVSVWPKPDWEVDELAAVALETNPELAVARAEWAASRAGLQTAGQRPNPGFAFGFEHHSDTSGGITPWGLLASLGWVVETGGKRQARLALAEARALVAREQAAAGAWRVRSAIQRACLALVGAERRQALLERRRGVVAESLKVLERRVELGELGGLEPSALRIEDQRVQLALNQARSEAVDARATLALALGLSPAALEGVAVRVADFDAPAGRAALPPREVRTQALLARHDLRAALAAYAVAEAELRLAVAAQFPDLTLSPGLYFEQNDTIWELGSALVLPLLHRNQGPIAEASARRDAEAARVLALQAGIIGEAEGAALRHGVAAAALADTEALLASVRGRQALIARQVELGYADQTEALRAEVESALAEELRESALLDLQRARASLEEALQRPLQAALTLPLLPPEPPSAGSARP